VGTQAVSPPPIRSTTLSLRPVLESAADTRRLIDDLLPEDELDEVRFRTRLLASELVSNSILHAELGPLDAITLEVELTAHDVRVEVRDPGRGLRPRIAPADRHAQVGRGLVLVGALSDRWGFSGRGPTRVWFEIDLPA
jgi:anti-sigma regulatory factor (Ser/Thr protein kinase)